MKLIISLVLVLVATACGLKIAQWRYQAQFNAKQMEVNQLMDQNRALNADREAWKIRANMAEEDRDHFKEAAQKATNDAAVLQKKYDEIARILKALPKPKLPVDPNDLPKDQEHLLGAFQIQGFQPFPIQDPKSLAFPLENSTKILALVMDAREYPGALKRIELLEDQNTTLSNVMVSKNQIITALNGALESTQKALIDMKEADRICEEELKNDKKAQDAMEGKTKAVEKELKAEKPKKWIYGGLGLLLGLGALLL
jgi:predicted nuclease with TOPRIM domain